MSDDTLGAVHVCTLTHDKKYTCGVCGNPTAQAPVIFGQVLYPPCCFTCDDAELWRSVPLNEADPVDVVLARSADACSIESAKIQAAFDTICKARGHKHGN